MTTTSNDHVAIDIQEASPPPQEESYDDDMLHRAVEDAGRWAFGTVLVEVWVLKPSGTKLVRPKGAWWIDPSFHTCGEDCRLCRLVDSSRPDFMPPEPLAPGVGLPGALWAEVDRAEDGQHHIAWRQVNALAVDPDQPFNPRLKLLSECGLGWAGAVPFHAGEHRGIVIYMAREHVDHRKLQAPTNEQYLMTAATLVGASYAFRGPRQECVRQRTAEVKDAFRRVSERIRALKRMGVDLRTLMEEPAATATGNGPESVELPKDATVCEQVLVGARQKAITTVKKMRGAAVKAPPTFSYEQTLWTFVGAFLTLAGITRLNAYLLEHRGTDSIIVLGPFGALVTLMYGLTAAPASQPRNAMLGQAISISISLAISYADGMDLWLRQTLATSLAVAAMVKLGITHPPAGAAALLFSSGLYEWSHLGFMIVGNVIAIGMATILNDLHSKRQYPTFWGFGEIMEFAKKRQQKTAPDNDTKPI